MYAKSPFKGGPVVVQVAQNCNKSLVDVLGGWLHNIYEAYMAMERDGSAHTLHTYAIVNRT